MQYFKLSVVLFVIALTVFFNIERLDFVEDNAINIDSFVYIIGFFAIIIIILLPRSIEYSPYIPIFSCIALHFLLKLFFSDQKPIFGGIQAYIYVTELALLSSVTFLAYGLSRALHDFEAAVEDVTLGDIRQQVPPLNEALEDIQKHMTFGRRYRRPLSVVIVELERDSLQLTLHRAVQEVQRTMMTRYALTRLARAFTRDLRRTDVMLEHREQGRLVILCPETDAGESAALVRRLQELVTDHHGISVACGSASFPDEALTFEELVRKAESHLQRPSGLSRDPAAVTHDISRSTTMQE